MEEAEDERHSEVAVRDVETESVDGGLAPAHEARGRVAVPQVRSGERSPQELEQSSCDIGVRSMPGGACDPAVASDGLVRDRSHERVSKHRACQIRVADGRRSRRRVDSCA
jgi:hypothetical protein